MPIRPSAAAAAVLLSLALPAHGQDAPPPADSAAIVAADTTPPTSLQKGSWSLSFAFPAYGTGQTAEFGAWEMVGARTNLGLVLKVSVFGQDAGSTGNGDITAATTDVELGANLKRYLMAPRVVTPYLLGSAAIGGRFERREGPGEFDETTRGMNTTARAAVGAEWFPVRWISISGHTGFSAFAGSYETEQDYPDGEHRDSESSVGGFNTFTSGLTVQIWF